MMRILVDQTDFPVVLVTIEGVATDAELEAYLHAMEGLIARAYTSSVRVAHVIDARRTLTTPAGQRRRLAAWMKAHDDANRETCAAFAFVFDSALARGLLTAVLWLQPLPARHGIFSTVGEALEWAREQARGAEPVGGSRCSGIASPP